MMLDSQERRALATYLLQCAARVLAESDLTPIGDDLQAAGLVCRDEQEFEVVVDEPGWRLARFSYHCPNVSPNLARYAVYGTWLFLVRPDLDTAPKFEAALREAARNWVHYERDMAENDGEEWPEYPQNWGDFINHCPANILEAHGLRLLDLPYAWELSGGVDHEETLT